MVGISIQGDAIRAVRVKHMGEKSVLKSSFETPLFENTIVNGELVDTDAFIEALVSLRDDMEISENEDVYVGLPNGIFKIDSLYIQSDGPNPTSVIDKIYESGLSRDFIVKPFFASGNFKTDAETFARHGMTQEQIQERVARQMNEDTGEEPKEPKTILLKTVSYAAIHKDKLDAYINAFSHAGLKTITMEPNAVARIRYLHIDATQPFLFVDVEYDYTTFVGFSERTGAFMMNTSDIGAGNIIVYRPDANGDEVETVNRTLLGKFLGFLNIFIDFFKGNSIAGTDTIQQIIFLDKETEVLIDETEKEVPDIEVFSAEDMFPINLSEKGLDQVMPENFYLYYLPIVLTENTDMEVKPEEDVDWNIEVNFVPQSIKEETMFKQWKQNIVKASYITLAAAGIFFAGIVGTNAFKIVQAGYLQGTPPEIIEKYDDAKKNGDILKDEIAKFNAVAKKKTPLVKTVDDIIAGRPNDIYITNFSLSGGKSSKTRKIVMECMTANSNAPQEFIDSITKVEGLEKARVLSQQVKEGKTAVQIVIPLSNGKGDAKEERTNKRRPNKSNKSNENKNSK